MQVFGLAQCLWYTRFTLTEHLLLLFSCLLNKLVMLSDHLSICMVYFTCCCNAGLKDSLQCCSSVTQCFGAFMGFGMLLLSLFVRNRFGPQLKVYFLKNIGAGNSSSSRPNNSFSTCHHTGNSGKISFWFGFESWLLLVGPFCVEST